MFKPLLDTYITVDLPGEKLRALIKKILSETEIVLQLTSTPLAKSHTYKKDDFVACKRVAGMFGEIWEAIESRPSLEDFMEKVNAKRTNSRTGQPKS